MLSKNMEKALNGQIRIEAESSQVYLSMASWAEVKGLEGISQFMYKHSDEERMHMLKLVKYVNERGGQSAISALAQPKAVFESFQKMFEDLYEHEIFVSKSINELVHVALEEKDYATHNFLQWFVAEQMEEEALARTILDKINLIGNDKSGLYLFDRDVQQITVESAAADSPQ
ncbi:MAG: ferritin [Eudoraea sp.]|nr:ferritin [Eudoraea sp.]